MSGWGKELADIWTNNVAPSRPSCSELALYTKYLRKIQEIVDHPIKLLVLGSTPEFRDWGYDENMEVNVVDKSEEYYKQISREIRHKNLKENVYFLKWEDMHFDEKYDIIIGDLSIGNIEPTRFRDFLINIRDALSDNGVFMGKSFIWSDTELVKTPKEIVDDYKHSIHIHPYTFINHQLGLYCLDKIKYSIDFGKMYRELKRLFDEGDIDEELFSYFQNVGWNTEMKFEFFAPSEQFFAQNVNDVLQLVKFEHTEDIYTNVFPIFIIKKKERMDNL